MSQQYTAYIVDHVNYVQQAFDWLVSHNLIDYETLPKCHIAEHDLSKYTEDEYDAYDKYFYGNGRKPEEVKNNFNYAWLHHIHNNPHHWQHWVLINDEDGTIALEMPQEYIYEMLSDWWAFSFKKGDLKEIFKWYDSHKANMMLHKNTKKLIEELLEKIKKILDKEQEIK